MKKTRLVLMLIVIYLLLVSNTPISTITPTIINLSTIKIAVVVDTKALHGAHIPQMC